MRSFKICYNVLKTIEIVLRFSKFHSEKTSAGWRNDDNINEAFI